MSRIRSFALVGHGGSGKTSIGEAIAHTTGLHDRLGRVDDRTGILDVEPEEHRRGGSITAHFLTCEFDGYKIHVVDTPGDGNFLHEARGVLQGVNAAVLVVSAVHGVEVSTELVSSFAAAQDIPRAAFINGMDRDNADHRACLAELEQTLGLRPVLLQVPIGRAGGFRGVVDLVYRRALVYEGEGGRPVEVPIPDELRAEVDAAVEHMMETVAMVDDELVEKYLDAGELTQDEIRRGLNRGILDGQLCPVLLGSALQNVAVDRLLWLARAFPHDGERRPRAGHAPGDPSVPVEILGRPDAPFAALCIKTHIDPYAGQISVLRVVDGTADSTTTCLNPRTERSERLAHLAHPAGRSLHPVDRVLPGDIVVVPKLRDTATGDTLCHPSRRVVLPYVEPPPAMIAYTIKPRSRSDVDKLKSGLVRLLAEDTALRQNYDEVTKELVLSGMGASHVQLSVEKLERKYGVNVALGLPAIPYRETVTGRADVRYRHKKQTGGAGQFGEVAIRVGPAARGQGFVFVNRITGGVIPTALIPSVEMGIGDKLREGVLAGFPCVDVEVELYDGKYHPVDSKDIAFQIAGRQAIKQAVLQARPVLLEPIYAVDVVIPSELVGDVMGDMNSRRGRVLTMDSRGRSSVVKALVPLAEILNYAPDLRSMTGGKGSYTMAFHGYEQVPTHLQDKLVDEIRRLADDDE